jgi:hypothetical protein
MSDLEKTNEAQLKNALITTDSQLQRRLPSEEFTALGILLSQTAKRYPNQDMSETLEEYMKDLEKLALRYSLQSVEDAITALRIDPEQEFFPTPDEIAAQMKRARLRNVPSHIYARG